MAYTAEEKADYRKQKQEEQRELLERAVDSFMTSEGFQRYLDTRARFHKYSFSNTILIALQRPEATQVAGRKQWSAKFNRTLLENDDQPIYILAPQITYEKDGQGNIIKDESGKNVIRFIWYKTVKVYDVAQTEGEALPEREEEVALQGNSHEEWLYRLAQYAGGVEFDTSLPVNAQVHNLTRRIAATKAAGEDHIDTIAEATAYLVCRILGLDTSAITIPHIAYVEGTDKQRMKSLKEFAGKIDEISNEILEAVRA